MSSEIEALTRDYVTTPRDFRALSDLVEEEPITAKGCNSGSEWL